jgi:phage terminase small subunit
MQAKKHPKKTARKKAPTTAKPLSVRQERFAEFVASGKPATVAYEMAGYAGGRNAEANACRLMDNDGVKALIAKLRKPQTEDAELNKEEKLRILAGIARDRGQKTVDRVRAIDSHSKHVGDFEPDRMEVETGPITLDTVREIAARIRIASPLLMSRMNRAGRVAKLATDIDAAAAPSRPAVRRPLSRVNKP